MPVVDPLDHLPTEFSALETLLRQMTMVQPDGSEGLLKRRLFAKTVDRDLPDYSSLVEEVWDS